MTTIVSRLCAGNPSATRNSVPFSDCAEANRNFRRGSRLMTNPTHLLQKLHSPSNTTINLASPVVATPSSRKRAHIECRYQLILAPNKRAVKQDAHTGEDPFNVDRIANPRR